MIKKLLVALAVISALMVPAFAQGVVHKIAFHVDTNDPALMNLTLNNVKNVTSYYESIGDSVQIEVVAYGPGLHMLRADTSPVSARVAAMALEIDGLTFVACGNTLRKMSEGAGREVELLEEAVLVQSGVVQLVMRQEQGWAYIRP